jgi:DNA modification methylase
MWSLRKHRVLCANSLLESSYTRLMTGRRASIVFADPPFNVRIDGHATGKGRTKHREFAMASGEMTKRQFTTFLKKALGFLSRNSVPGSVHYICMDWRHIGELLGAGERIYSELLNCCVWVKSNGGMGSLYRSKYELVFIFKAGTARHQNHVLLGKHGRNRTNVWTYPSANSFGGQGEEGNSLVQHPTKKPVAMIADALLDCSARGAIVLDNFLGSGSTLLAAERVGRICYGIELDPIYVDVAIRRWQRYTGEHAVDAATGKRFDELAQKAEVRHG